MNKLPYEINEHIMNFAFDIKNPSLKDIINIKNILLVNKLFYNIFTSYSLHKYNTKNISEFINRQYNVCIICHSNKILYFKKFCKKCCTKLDLITATDAKNKYFVNDIDLDKLDSIVKKQST